MAEPIGVVAMIHGSAASLDRDSIADYLRRVMRGRSPTPAQVGDLRRRYELVGGTAHLIERSRQQVERLATTLGSDFQVELGAKHSQPFIAEAVARLADRGMQRVIGIALAPHESLLTTREYDEAGAKAGADAGLRWKMVRSWHTEPDLVALWSDLVTEAMTTQSDGATVLFSAHSLPIRAGDPYLAQVAETAAAVAGEAGLGPEEWQLVFQSVPPGVDPSGWLGPNLAESYPAKGSAVVAPVGFVSDHLEVLFDIDLQAREEAAAAGVRLSRTRMPNDDPRLARAIASAITATT